MTDSPTTLLEEAKTLYSKKEDDYGESWKLTGEILSKIIKQQGNDELVIPAEPEYLIALGLYTRRLDKLVRSFNGTFMKDALKVDESVEETVEDQIPYAAMQATVAGTLNEETEEEEVERRTDYEYCCECGNRAADRISLEASDTEYEYFCECGYVWHGE